MLAGAVGMRAVEDQYKADVQNYQMMKSKLASQLINQDIEAEKIPLQLQQLQAKAQRLKQEEDLMKYNIPIENILSIYGDDFKNDMMGILKSWGFNDNINPAEYELFQKTMKELFPKGLDQAYQVWLDTKIANAKTEEEKKKYTQLKEQARQRNVSPNVEEQYNQAKQLELLRQQGRIDLETLRQKFAINREQLKNIQQGLTNANNDKEFNAYLKLYSTLKSNNQKLYTSLANYINRLRSTEGYDEAQILSDPGYMDLANEINENKRQMIEIENLINLYKKGENLTGGGEPKIEDKLGNIIRLWKQGRISQQKAEEMIEKTRQEYKLKPEDIQTILDKLILGK
jgi:hypothetical protein